MKHSKSRLLAAGLALVFLVGLANAQAADPDNPKNKQKNPPAKPAVRVPPTRPPTPATTYPITTKPAKPNPARPVPDRPVQPKPEPTKPEPAKPELRKGQPVRPEPRTPGPAKPGPTKPDPTKPEPRKVPPIIQDKPKPLPPAPVRPAMTKVEKPDGVVEDRTAGGKLRGTTKVDQKTGEKQSQQLSTTGRVEKEEVVRRDGTKQIKELDLGSREKKVTVVHADKKTETTDVHYNRFGKERDRETITTDAKGAAVSKTVVVKQNFVVNNTTIVNANTTVVRNYHPGRWGFVYRPVVIAPVVFSAWYDPYWYGPVHHPFTYSWGWHDDPWYRYHAYYWEPYPVYAAPSYWVTDWLVAGYVADRYAVATSIEQTREEVRLAREEAENARGAAEQANDAAEIAEAKAAQAQAEARAERAEARALKAEAEEGKRKELAGKPNPNAKPIDKETKDALKDQVERTIAEKKVFAEESAKNANAVPPDVATALADPKHIFPVSKSINVTRTEDRKSAGTLTAGDLLQLEPGQENTLKDATENTFISMRVMTSKGEDDSVPAGTLIAVPLKELQEFDNEFRAKIDLGLAEADKNKDAFKKGVVAQ